MKGLKKHKNTIIKGLGILLSIAILGFMVKEFIKNWQAIKPYLDSMSVWVLIVSVAIYAAVFMATGYNWSYLLWKMDSRASKREYLNIHMVSALARYIPGGIWNIVGKAYMCTEKGVEKSATTASMILEYVFQILSSGLFFLFFIPVLLKDWISPILLVLLLLLVLAVLVLLPWAVQVGILVLGKVFKEDLSGMKLSKCYVYQILVRYMVVWLVTGVGLIVLVSAFSKLEFMQAVYLVLSYPVSWVAGFLSPSPNGMGVREGVLQVLLGSGYHYELILLITLTTRIWTILGEVLSFIVFKCWYYLTKKKG